VGRRERGCEGVEPPVAVAPEQALEMLATDPVLGRGRAVTDMRADTTFRTADPML